MAEPGSNETVREMSQDGADITGAASLTGGWGIRGWLSAIFKALTTEVVTISWGHEKVHQGQAFSAHLDNLTANTNDHRTFIGFQCPDTAVWAHLIMSVGASSPAEAFFVEDVTIDLDEGIEIVAYDRNRNTANASNVIPLTTAGTPGSISCYDETALAGANFSYATELEHVQLIAGQGPKAVGGSARGEQEWILKQGVKYGLFVQNIGANANLHELHFDFYEHESEE